MSKKKENWVRKTNFTAQEILDFVAGYDITHMPYLPGKAYLSGFFESSPPRLSLVSRESICESRKAALHELLHAYHYEQGHTSPREEERIDEETEIIYKKWYGRVSRH